MINHIFISTADLTKIKNFLFCVLICAVTKARLLNSSCHFDFATSIHHCSYCLQIEQSVIIRTNNRDEYFKKMRITNFDIVKNEVTEDKMKQYQTIDHEEIRHYP